VKKYIYFLFLFYVFLARSFAIDIMRLAEYTFFDPNLKIRLGIEVEYKGINTYNSAKIVQKVLGGRIEKEKEYIKTTIKEYDKNGKPIYNVQEIENVVIKDTKIGTITLKPDLNQVSDELNLNESDVVTELVTEPLYYKDIESLQKVITELKIAGAIGTREDVAVATQVNAEFNEGNRKTMKTKNLLNLMRSYLSPQSRFEIETYMQKPEIRKKYMNNYSKGFLEKLLNPNYEPTWRELYDDFIYRQSLELLGFKDAWSIPIKEARKLLLKQKNPIVPTVVKLNPIRISSLLMFVLPDDPMSKLYEESGWAKARPLVEFREWNNDFNVISPVKQTMGLINAANKYGYYDPLKAAAQESGMDLVALQNLHDDYFKSLKEKSPKPIIFRYFLGDPNYIDRDEYADMMKAYKNQGVVGFLSYQEYGRAPVFIPGESIVFHRRPQHRFSVLGKYNPGLINYNIAQALENKYVEALFWEEYAKGVMPKTILLENFGKKFNLDKLENLVGKLNEAFPNGWVLKGTWDLGTEKNIITSDDDIVKEVHEFLKSDFLSYKKAVEREMAEYLEAAPEYVLAELKKHKNYKGYKIYKMLEKPHEVIVQEKLKIKREFRVEVIGGKVLGRGTTIDRYFYMYKYKFNGLSMKDYVPPSKSVIAQVENFVQSFVDKLPEELKTMPFGMDIALLEDGSFKMIESNPGGNSNFLFEEEDESVKVLGEYLENYPKLVSQGLIHEGMSAQEQMKYLKSFFKKHNITQKFYPNMKFLSDRIEDPEFKPVKTDPNKAILKIEKKPLGKACYYYLSK
jgi:hypothetical protein